MKHAKIILALAALSPLAACISFGSEPPPTLLTLEPDAKPAAGASWSGDVTSALVVQQPTLAKKLNTTRVPVQLDPSNVAYLTDTAWVEKPDKLLQRLLAETISASSSRLVVDSYIAGGRQALNLEGELIEFGVDEQTMEVVMVYDAVLTGTKSTIVRKQRFEAREPVAKVKVAPVSEALNRAANRIAADVAAWIE